MNLGDNLKRIRKDNNLSQEQFADKLGVSRQAVSKWESGLAIPEMEKLIMICKMFNLNIDELLNQDIREVNDTKQTKNNINKYIDDFLMFITKTIDMFSSMSFKTKIKCLFEQCIIVGVIAIILSIVGSILFMLVQNILMLLPDDIYYIIYNMISDIYVVFCIVLCVVLLVHIFKVRYLDYYVIVREDDSSIVDDSSEKDNNLDDLGNKNRIYLEKKQEKIIIRDPENAGDRFVSFILKGLLLMVKTFVLFMAFWFCCSLIFFSFLLVISFLFVKTGLVFVGALLMIVSAIIVNVVILNLFYNFIISKKCKKNLLAILFVIGLSLFGVGGGLFGIGATDFEVSNYDNSVKEEKVISWNEQLRFCDYYGIEYVESNNNDIRIVYEHSEFYDLVLSSDGNIMWFDSYSNYDDAMEVIRNYIEDINNKRIVDYSDVSIKIYTNRDNIEKLKSNSLSY